MKQGTVSVLLGCHSPIHSIVVLIAWKKLYGRWPNWWQAICIFLHDIGHWGKNYLDDYDEKKKHDILGARIAGWLFGEKGHNFIAGHNTYSGVSKSQLHDPDKYSWVIAPIWWMTANAWFEPKLQRKGYTRKESAIMFRTAMKENMDTGFREIAHEIYLEQWHGKEKN